MFCLGIKLLSIHLINVYFDHYIYNDTYITIYIYVLYHIIKKTLYNWKKFLRLSNYITH